MITLRYADPWELPLSCGARRGGKRSKIYCENDALHGFGCRLRGIFHHIGRGVRDPRGFFIVPSL